MYAAVRTTGVSVMKDGGDEVDVSWQCVAIMKFVSAYFAIRDRKIGG